MKKKLFISLIVTTFLGTNIVQAKENSQTTKPIIPVVKLGENVQVKFGGFVRADYYVDSREIVGAVDDLFGFFPEKEKINSGDSKDQNEVIRQNLSTQATRFNALFTGPEALNAKSTAFFEYDFSGGTGTQTTTGATNSVGLRLRHAWAKLTWNKTEVLVGKTWNPLAETIFPSVVGLHTGIPFRPFGRADQLRVTLKPSSEVDILLAAVYQSEHKSFVYSDGTLAAAVSNTNDIRSNPIPDLHVQLHYKNKDLFAGVVAEYKTVRPATQTTGTLGTFNTNESISSYALGGFADYKKGLYELKGSVLYGQNLSELFQQGGYAVKTYDAATGARTYSVSNSTSGWINATYGKNIIVGLFAGYQKNHGFDDNILSSTSGGASAFL